MEILLIGAGYVGTAVLENFRGSVHTFYITTTSANKVEGLRAYSEHVHLIDPLDNSHLQKLVNICDCLILTIAPKKDCTYAETYLGTAKILTKMLENRTKPLHLIYTGSTSVYEGLQSNCATENDSLRPFTDNPQILYETENELLKNPSTCILRLSGIYGPGRSLLDRAKRMSGVKMTDQGNQITNHIHLDDIVSAISFCIDNNLKGVYNLTNDSHPQRNELYDSLCLSINIPPPIWNSEVAGKTSYKISNEKIKGKGFLFKHPFL